MNTVDRLDHHVGFEQVFLNYVCPGRPCILSAAADNWPCRFRWTPSFLAERFGEVLVDFVDVETGRRSPRPLREYFDLPEEAMRRFYVCDWDFRKLQPELIADVGEVPHFDVDWIDAIPTRSRPDLIWIYIGHADTHGPCHVDNYGTSAWLAVLQGRKRVRFLRPRRGVVASSVDLFGDQAPAEVEEAVLEPGDILYVPSGIWHAAWNDSYCLSLTANFLDGANFMDHHAFQTRGWHGRRILITRLNALQDLPPGSKRGREARHLALALASYRAWLTAELEELDTFDSVLAEHSS